MRLELAVPDLRCQHCVRTVEGALRALGASDVKVDLGAKRVGMDADEAKLPAILAALEAEGYPARPA